MMGLRLAFFFCFFEQRTKDGKIIIIILQMEDYCGTSYSNCSTIISSDTAITLHGSVVIQVRIVSFWKIIRQFI